MVGMKTRMNNTNQQKKVKAVNNKEKILALSVHTLSDIKTSCDTLMTTSCHKIHLVN